MRVSLTFITLSNKNKSVMRVDERVHYSFINSDGFSDENKSCIRVGLALRLVQPVSLVCAQFSCGFIPLEALRKISIVFDIFHLARKKSQVESFLNFHCSVN
jgi:hypothetical protein